MNWNILVLVVCLFLAVFCIWKEISRANKLRLVWRIVASIVAIAALACIVLPVKYTGKIINAGKNGAVLLTEGFDADSLSRYKTDTIFTADPLIKRKYPKAKLITLDELASVTPRIKELYVLGYGLNRDELKQLNNLPVHFFPGSAPGGIMAVNWPGRLKQGQLLKVQGNYNNQTDQSVRLVLKGLNTRVDSTIIGAKGSSNFELKTTPKTVGRSIYQLLALSGTDTLANENLPVEIDPDKPLKVLILSAAPGFENRFLKNWLSENGFGVASRSTISKGKFNSDYINIRQTPLDHLSPGLLGGFDVVIGDLSVLGSLNTAESAALKQQVTQKGIGLIVNADTILKSASWLQNDFPVQRSATKDQKPETLLIQGRKIGAKALTAEQLLISDHNGTQQLVTDEQNRILAGITIAGSGKLVFTSLNNTYTWMLAGSKIDYTALWSLLIGKAAMTVPQTETWQTTCIPAVGEPVEIKLEIAAAVNQITADDVPVSPVQNGLLPFQWKGTWWPSAAGWHSVKRTDETPGWLYVNKAGSWKTIKALGRISAAKKYAALTTGGVSVTKEIQQKTEITVPKIYFYVLLLLACTYLWLESKLSN